MKFKKILAGALFAVSAGAFALNGGAAPSKIVIFGDSLSDAGYQDELTAVPLFHDILNGKLATWTTYIPDYSIPANGTPGYPYGPILMEAYGLISLSPLSNLQPVNNTNPPADNLLVSGNLNSFIYAAGGATTTGVGIQNIVDGIVVYNPPPIQYQIDQYLSNHDPSSEANAVYIIWAGANNIFKNESDPASLPGVVDGATTDIANQVNTLITAGAKHIIVMNLPDLGSTALAIAGNLLEPGLSASLTELSVTFNLLLEAKLDSANKNVVEIIDVFPLLSEIISQGSITLNVGGVNGSEQTFYFNMVYIDGALRPACGLLLLESEQALDCLPVEGSVGNDWHTEGAGDYLFTDGVHPSFEGHTVIANIVRNRIDSSWNPGNNDDTGWDSLWNFLYQVITLGIAS